MNKEKTTNMKAASRFEIKIKRVRSIKTIELDLDTDENIKGVTQHAALKRLLWSGKFSYHILMKLIKIQENALKHRNMIKKLKKSQEKYTLVIRNVMRTTSIDTDLELDVESLTNLREPDDALIYKIKGKNIVENVPETIVERNKPILFQTRHVKDIPKTIEESTTEPIPDGDRGIIRYKLSDRTFIDKGWTVLPIEKVVQKKNIYRVVPAHPEFNWFTKNKSKGPMKYDTGEKLAEFDANGRGRWYYRNGRLALHYYESEEGNFQQRYLIYSSGEPDENGRSRPVTVLAMFDFLGNAVVFDHAGKIRIKYNQSDGVVLDRGIGPVSHWKWHSLNDPPVLQRVMMDTYSEEKDPIIMQIKSDDDKKPREDFPDMLDIEFRNCIKDQTKKLTQKFQPYQIKMKALKINEQFSLRIIDQANVYLIFRDGSANFKLNLGMVIDNQQILHTENEDLGDVATSLDNIRDPTESIMDLQQKLLKARRQDQIRSTKEMKVHPIVPVASVDRLTAGLSKPLYRPARTVMPKDPRVSCERVCPRKPSKPNLYYNNRLI